MWFLTSMRGGLLSNPGPDGGEIWRLVEAQHRLSTMKLVDSPSEHDTLEKLLDETKPLVPDECSHLHWLLFTPFRYDARRDSRFRRQGRTPAIFYAAEHIETAVAEMAFWRLLFFIESPGTPWPANPLEMTAFSVRVETATCLDLTRPPYDAQRDEWRHPTDYTPAHTIADEARAMGCEIIRSLSARDPDERCNVSVLTCAAFRDREPVIERTWHLHLQSSGVSCVCESPRTALHFGREAFARDPRIMELNWDR